MTPFEVYLILNADSFRWLFGIAAASCLMVAIVMSAVATDCYIDDDKGKSCFRHARRILITGIASGALAFAIPSTKTLAAMVVVPTITTPQALHTMKKSAGQLYDLAVDALKSAVNEGHDHD